ncbi:MAG: hypothetical protein JW991_00895 [Candidatus Pacebacteria bacterium]|nr:hypothetical protein [Candidatus Paceibacterota bacterium]
MKKKSLKITKGYSLIEILIYSSILSLFLVLLVQIFISIKLANAHSTAFVTLSKNLRQMASDMTRTIRGAAGVTSPTAGNSTATLSLNDGVIVYQLQDGFLKKTDSGQTWDLTTNEVTVTDLSFTNTTEATQTAVIKIKVTAESNYLLQGGRKLSENWETTISLR